MDISTYLYNGGKKYNAGKFNSAATEGIKGKKEAAEKLLQNIQKMDELQQMLYASGKNGLLIIFQAMDAAGKDSTIKHVFSGLNQQGVNVTSYKQPCTNEISHDYLWRIHAAVPARGSIAIFNRSHYEEVLVAKVLNLPKSQNLPASALKNIWPRRYRQIREFEQYLTENGIAVVKIHLSISKKEQAKRFLSRLEDPTKNWKFERGDLDTRDLWDDYMKAYQDAINNTATPGAPWYVVPADKKWYARLAVSEIVLDALKDIHPSFPKLNGQQKQGLEEGRALLAKSLPGEELPIATPEKSAAKSTRNQSDNEITEKNKQ